MVIIDAVIKLILSILKFIIDFKIDSQPELTKEETQTEKELFNDEMQSFKRAIAENNIDAVNVAFSKLRNDIEFATSPATGGAEAGNSDHSGGHGDSALTTGQQLLQSEQSVDSGSVPAEPNSAFSPPGVSKRNETNRVIFHHSASDFGDVDDIDRWHRERGFACVGYHFVVPRDGRFQAGRKLQLVGAHAQGQNSDSIGVCIVGNLQNYPVSASQESECVRLYHDLCRAYSKKLDIEFHHEECPGKHLDREAFKKTLTEAI